MRSRFVSLCLLFALLSGCTLLQKSDPPPEKTQEKTAPAPTEEPQGQEPEVPQGPLNPLTGLETGDARKFRNNRNPILVHNQTGNRRRQKISGYSDFDSKPIV